jgi:prepilin-type N-terminal cleavage/methylation domain-containing protein
MRHNIKAFTLVEMLVALAVSSIIVAATYASFELIQKQYKKNIDVAELHTSGRAIMTILEREIRMAGYEFRDGNGLMTYGNIISPLVVTDSGNKCCDDITIIYDEVFDTLNASGVVTSSTVERIQTRFWVESYSTNKRGSRHRLYKRRTILGTNNAILSNPRIGTKEVMADYIDDLQFINTSGKEYIYTVGGNNDVHKYDTSAYQWVESFNVGYNSYPGAIDIGSDEKLYSVVQKNGKSSIQIVNLKTQTYTYIDSPGSNSRFAPGLAFGPDGKLYVNTGAGGAIDVYDISNNQFVQTITNPSSLIKNLTSGNTDTSSNGMVCKVIFGRSPIQCSNPTKTPNQNGPYKAVRFDSQGRLYAASDSSDRDIDVFDGTGRFIKGIKVGKGGQKRNTQTLGIASLSNIKTLSTVDINLTLRTKEKYGKSRQFLKKDYFNGNFNFNKNDQFFRDTFSTTVSVRNL